MNRLAAFLFELAALVGTAIVALIGALYDQYQRFVRRD